MASDKALVATDTLLSPGRLPRARACGDRPLAAVKRLTGTSCARVAVICCERRTVSACTQSTDGEKGLGYAFVGVACAKYGEGKPGCWLSVSVPGEGVDCAPRLYADRAELDVQGRRVLMEALLAFWTEEASCTAEPSVDAGLDRLAVPRPLPEMEPDATLAALEDRFGAAGDPLPPV